MPLTKSLTTPTRLTLLLGFLLTTLFLSASAFAQTFTTLLNFNGTNGSRPVAGVTQGRNGDLFGTTTYGGTNDDGAFFGMTPSGGSRVQYSFGTTDTFRPNGVILSTDGNFYGTTPSGGTGGAGAIFKVSPSGTYTLLASIPQGFKQGEYPDAPLAMGVDGNFYGTTSGDQSNSDGSVFKVTSSGTFRDLHNFHGSDGSLVFAPVALGPDGNLYGTTYEGGANNIGGVFKLTPEGALTTLHSFDRSDGSNPRAGLVLGGDGSFYGTTEHGGNQALSGGTIFKITLSGTLTTLYNFTDGSDGGYPQAPLLVATDGNFYGTTSQAGAQNGGTLFQFTPAGQLNVLHSFDFNAAPQSNLTQHTNGKIYGTTFNDGTSGDGTVFSLDVGLGPFVGLVQPFGIVGSNVQILGQSLTGTTGVSFNGLPASSFTIELDTFITAVVPSGATTGLVTVTTPGGTLTSNVNFTVR